MGLWRVQIILEKTSWNQWEGRTCRQFSGSLNWFADIISIRNPKVHVRHYHRQEISEIYRGSWGKVVTSSPSLDLTLRFAWVQTITPETTLRALLDQYADSFMPPSGCASGGVGDRVSGLTSVPNNSITWTEVDVKHTVSMILPIVILYQ